MSDSMEPIREPPERSSGPRVLQVLPALGEGGAERDTVELARYLIEYGWTPLVASSGGRSEVELCNLGVASFRLPLHAKNPLVIRANISRLQRLAEAQGVQLIHAHSRAAAWSSFYAARRCGIPFVTTFHGVYRGSGRFFKRRYNGIMAQGERVIAISEHVAAHVRERYGVAADRLRVVPRGIDLAAFAPEAVARERIADLAARWQVPRGAEERVQVLMLPGRITRIKGHLLLLEALERMSRRNFVCLLVGSLRRRSRYVREIERQIEARGLAGVARLAGGCSDMPAALALADVVVVPSTGPEAFGRVSIEAQALGKPVVATDVGGLGETLMPAATGWLVPPDPAELAGALELALAMPHDARARLAVRARRMVQRRFSSERAAASTIAVYRELLGGQAPASLEVPRRVPGAAPGD